MSRAPDEDIAAYQHNSESALFHLIDRKDLKVAQLRKISLLIEKARVTKNHEILETRCRWGSLAIEVVKRIGCKYIRITSSEEQLKYAKMRVRKQASRLQILDEQN